MGGYCMRLSLLKHLVCVYCKGKLSAEAFVEKDGHIEEGVLRCMCKRKYPIIKGVPRMLPDRWRWFMVVSHYPDFLAKYNNKVTDATFKEKAELHKLANLNKFSRDTGNAFGIQWHIFSKLYPEDEDNFFSWLKPIPPGFFNGKLVLDAGCGNGKHIYFSTKHGAETIGIDFSTAVDVAYALNKTCEKAHIVQADIYNLPFRKETFDYVYSIGVVHHLHAPQLAFTTLLTLLKKGCPINIWVYGRENNGFVVYFVTPLRRIITSRISKQHLLAIAKIFRAFLKPLIRTNKKLSDAQLTRGMMPYFPLHSFLLYLSRLHDTNVLQILFDQLNPPKAIYYRKDALARWCDEALLEDVIMDWRNKNSWCVHGKKAKDSDAGEALAMQSSDILGEVNI